ncbi:Hypothetical predicted protein [Olea europaea subsp. europaea]|uniref:Uncharacterized protein n=1 Tax=Olea europaea subsp. europaea TaxID=158383 RepID=A0A8S0S1E2_OLEEU|nr:Hypothetical predicted protein [Olea europaea subsp. europaea]
MFPTEVQLMTSLCYKYWTEKYANYVETCDAVDMMKTGLAVHARSGFFMNAQMNMRRFQKLNKEFERKASEAIADGQKLKNEVAAVEEALEASKLKNAELESEKANKEKVELKAKVEGLTADATGLKQKLKGVGATAVEEYIAHFLETFEDEFIPAKPFTLVDEEVPSGKDVD